MSYPTIRTAGDTAVKVVVVNGGGYANLSGAIANVRTFGAKGDGVTDDTDAIEAARDALLETGGVIYMPGGVYVTDTVVLTNTSSSDHGPRISIQGDGMNTTRLLKRTGADPTIHIIGNETPGTGGVHSRQYIRDLSLGRVDSGLTGTGIYIEDCAYVNLSRVFASNYDVGLAGDDMLSSKLDNCQFSGNNMGIRCTYADGAYSSGPNAIGLYQCVISSNNQFGAYFNGPSNVCIFGGSIEVNGIYSGLPASERFGLKLDNSGLYGAVGLSINGTYLEYNGGTADIWLTANAQEAAHVIMGCSFVRMTASDFVTNNILVQADAGLRTPVSVIGCGFKPAAGYTPSAARPCISMNGVGAVLTQMGNLFYSSVDDPS